MFLFFSDDIDWVRRNFSLKYKCFFITPSISGEEHIDLFLMSQCKHNIIANSTFSWWAAWLNNNERKIIISPKKWSMAIENSNSISPASWYKI